MQRIKNAMKNKAFLGGLATGAVGGVILAYTASKAFPSLSNSLGDFVAKVESMLGVK